MAEMWMTTCCLGLFERDSLMRFLTSGFFVKHLPLGHCFSPLSVFANHFEFTEIFELKVNSPVSMTPLSQKNLLKQPTFFKLLPQRRRVVKFTIAWILFDCLFKENESL
jgi:hypothetical protein